MYDLIDKEVGLIFYQPTEKMIFPYACFVAARADLGGDGGGGGGGGGGRNPPPGCWGPRLRGVGGAGTGGVKKFLGGGGGGWGGGGGGGGGVLGVLKHPPPGL